eukprot:SAG31_NODE_1780_length_7290_cov_1.784036_6_plen_126_part_00
MEQMQEAASATLAEAPLLASDAADLAALPECLQNPGCGAVVGQLEELAGEFSGTGAATVALNSIDALLETPVRVADEAPGVAQDVERARMAAELGFGLVVVLVRDWPAKGRLRPFLAPPHPPTPL